MSFGEGAIEPGTSECPIGVNGTGRDAECFSRLLNGEAAEKPQLHDLTLTLIKLRQVFKRIIEGYKIGRASCRERV